MWIAGLLLCVAGIALAIVGVLSRQARLPRNMWAGLRTNTIMRTDQTWRAAHTAGAPWLLAAAGVAFALAAVAFVGSSWQSIRTLAILLLGLMIACLILAVTYGDRAARKVANDPSGGEDTRHGQAR
jgi:SdpI/YfhL protein family